MIVPKGVKVGYRRGLLRLSFGRAFFVLLWDVATADISRVDSGQIEFVRSAPVVWLRFCLAFGGGLCLGNRVGALLLSIGTSGFGEMSGN